MKCVEFLEHRQKMFLVVTLAGLKSDFDEVRDQILASLLAIKVENI